MKIFNDIYNIIENSSSIGVVAHKNPDGDTVCSALALVLALSKRGKIAELICDDVIDPKLNIIPRIELFNLRALLSYDTVIVVDSSDISRIGESSKLLPRAKHTISIDHHKTHEKFTEISYLQEASSNCENVYNFISEHYNEYIDATIAEILFAGIITDTGGFGNSSVNSDSHAIASQLLKFNFDSNKIYYHFIKANTYDTFMLKMRSLSKTMFFADRQIAVVVFSQEDFKNTNTNMQNTSGLLYDIINIEEVKIAVGISEVKDKNFKISLRTKGNADAATIAQYFGGGGHTRAAGFVRNGYVENVIDEILKVCADNL
ncbi:MAG: hypothetical protein EOM87_02565 [Clostridia bacterium]|nr:hypothetical protein [Clostridia bacterium]